MSRLYNERANALFAGNTAPSGIATVFRALEQHLVQPVLTWHRKRVTYNELMALDDRQLADIGVGRGQIERITGASHRF